MEVILSLGSNLNDRENNLTKALSELSQICSLTKQSKIYETPPWGKTNQANFLNQVVVAETKLQPQELLEQIHLIEAKLGRVRQEKWGPRIIDIDILYYGNLILNQENLIIPHPYLQERAFVLDPLEEIYSDKIDPRYNLTVRELNKTLKTGEKMNKVGAIVLAAGKGTRMRSTNPKVAFQLADKSLVERVVETASKLNSNLTCVIVGYAKEKVMELVSKYDNIAFAEQKEQLGTGHAVKMAREVFADFAGDIFILCGDVPLTTPKTLQGLLQTHRANKAACTVLTHVIDDPARYGRIIRDAQGNIDCIVEYKDATDKQREIREINTGIYVFKKEMLFSALEEITNDNAQHEYYLPDTLKILNLRKEIVAGHILDNFVEAAGINSQEQLAQLETEYYNDIKRRWMNNGVSIENPSSVIIGEDVTIGRDVQIAANVVIKGDTKIADEAIIGVNSFLKDAEIGFKCQLKGFNIVINNKLSANTVLDYTQTLLTRES